MIFLFTAYGSRDETFLFLPLIDVIVSNVQFFHYYCEALWLISSNNSSFWHINDHNLTFSRLLILDNLPQLAFFFFFSQQYWSPRCSLSPHPSILVTASSSAFCLSAICQIYTWQAKISILSDTCFCFPISHLLIQTVTGLLYILWFQCSCSI